MKNKLKQLELNVERAFCAVMEAEDSLNSLKERLKVQEAHFAHKRDVFVTLRHDLARERIRLENNNRTN